MRRLAWFSGGFCAAALAAALAWPAAWILAAAGAAAGLCALLRRSWLPRAVILCLGLCAGCLWCGVWAARQLPALAAWDGRTAALTVEASGYSRATAYGTATDAVLTLDGHRHRAVVYGGPDVQLRPGDRITGTMALAATDGTWGSETVYQASRGVDFTASLAAGCTVEPAASVPLRYAPAVLAHRLESVLLELLPPDEGGYAAALLTGRRDGISDRLDGQLRRSGTLHVVAVSGMHVSILTAALLLLLGNRRRLGALVALPLIWCFSLAVGMTASVVRAAVMQTVLLLAPILRRENDPPTSLLAALMVLVLPNPRAVLDVGLQLSFASAAGLLLFSRRCYGALCAPRPVRRLLKSPAGLVLRPVLAGVAASVAVLPLTMPLNLLYFDACSLAAPLSSALIVPLIPAAFVLTVATAALGLGWLPAAAVLAVPLQWLLALLIGLTRWIAGLPFASLSAGSGYQLAFLAGVYGILLAVLLARKPLRPAVPAGCAVSLFCLCLLLSSLELDAAQLSVTVLDVGQGQCIYAESKGASAVYDCGGDGDPAGTAFQFLQDRGRFSVDFLVVSHYDADHAGGVAELLRLVEVGAVYLPATPDEAGRQAEILAAAAETGTAAVFLTADTALPFGAAAVTLLAPVRPTDGNDGSVAALWQSAGFDVLLTGDLSAEAEEALLAAHPMAAVEVLVAGHHGAASTTGPALLAALEPETVLISVGAGNGYGHPAPETLARLAEAGAAVYRTDQCGNITVRR